VFFVWLCFFQRCPPHSVLMYIVILDLNTLPPGPVRILRSSSSYFFFFFFFLVSYRWNVPDLLISPPLTSFSSQVNRCRPDRFDFPLFKMSLRPRDSKPVRDFDRSAPRHRIPFNYPPLDRFPKFAPSARGAPLPRRFSPPPRASPKTCYGPSYFFTSVKKILLSVLRSLRLFLLVSRADGHDDQQPLSSRRVLIFLLIRPFMLFFVAN